MTNRTRAGVVLFALANGLAGCDDGRPATPTAPTAPNAVASAEVPPTRAAS